MKTIKIITIIIFFLLSVGNSSFAKGKLRESAVEYKIALQTIARCNLAQREGVEQFDASANLQYQGGTKQRTSIANALKNSPVFSTYVVVQTRDTSSLLEGDALKELTDFLSNPHKQVPFVKEKNGQRYRFYFSKNAQSWASVDVGRGRIYLVVGF